MTEARRSTNSEYIAFVNDMTRQECGKYVLVVLGLGQVHRFSRGGDAEHFDVLMPDDPDARMLTFSMLSRGGRIDQGALSPEEARNILDEMAGDRQGEPVSYDA